MDHSTHRELVDGTRVGLAASAARAGLSALSLLYGLGVGARNAAYRAGLLRVRRAQVPVVSVGNLTAGGTGKTPIVAYLAEWFTQRGVPPAILSRGYRALADGHNDERMVLDQLCPGVPHVQDADRVRGAELACREHHTGVLILDDGYQHRRLHRDVNLLLIDALEPWGFGRLLPRGYLREPLREIRRADLVIVTRADQCPPEKLAEIKRELEKWRGNDACVLIAFQPNALIDFQGVARPLTPQRDEKIAAFCGIGNPAGFRRSLVDLGWRVDEENFRTFPDHHHYQDDDLRELEQWAAGIGATRTITTQKDLVKIPRRKIGELDLLAVRIAARPLAGAELLEECLLGFGTQ